MMQVRYTQDLPLIIFRKTYGLNFIQPLKCEKYIPLKIFVTTRQTSRLPITSECSTKLHNVTRITVATPDIPNLQYRHHDPQPVAPNWHHWHQSLKFPHYCHSITFSALPMPYPPAPPKSRYKTLVPDPKWWTNRIIPHFSTLTTKCVLCTPQSFSCTFSHIHLRYTS